MSAVVEQSNELEIVKIADNIKSGLELFDSRKQELTELAAKAKDIKINGIDDTDTIKYVSQVRKSIKASRVAIEKEGKAMRDPLTAISKHISGKEKELIAIIEPTEKQLLAQEKWVEDEKERIRLEQEAKENARVQARIDKLAQYGFTIDYNIVKSYSDEDFERTVSAAKAEYEKEQAEKAEAERLRLEQEETERREREAEALRMQKEREELERLRAEQAAAQKKIDEENARIASEQKKIQEEKDKLERERQEAIAAKQRTEEIERAKAEAAEKARLKAIEDARLADERKKEEERKAKIAAEKKAARLPDKTKLVDFANRLGNIIDFEVKSTEAQCIIGKVNEMIGDIQSYIIKESESL